MTRTCASGPCDFKGIIPMEKNTLKDLKKLKILKIEGIKISQENIDEIATLDNLESLSFDYSYLDDSLNYKPINNLQKLTKLEILSSNFQDSDYELYYPKDIPKDLVTNKGIKELTLPSWEDPSLIDPKYFPNLETLTFESDNIDLNILGKFDKLTNLTIGSPNGDLSKLKNLKSL
ncbi:hypothetical protein PIROE2DRAFT_9762 [Piromyces sp. E2]|nr:hypothetical protein PIROE2DRAFT_9762 [Piromyces sp. E2]|eukprot:OUM63617.1 hypothetical protein PIROE2DRAFT_9762 [Piromyces sp. E2]